MDINISATAFSETQCFIVFAHSLETEIASKLYDGKMLRELSISLSGFKAVPHYHYYCNLQYKSKHCILGLHNLILFSE